MTRRPGRATAAIVVAWVLLTDAGTAQSATVRERAEHARRVLEGEPPPAELETAMATMRELFARRNDPIADADAATAIVLAIGTLVGNGDPEAAAELPRALDLHREFRLHQLTSWLTALWVLETQDPGAAIDRMLQAIDQHVDAAGNRVPDTDCQLGRFVIDLCCQEWRLADAEKVLAWMRDLPALADELRELVAGEVASAEFRVLLQRGEPERAVLCLQRTAAHLAAASPEPSPLREHLRANHTIDWTRYLLGNDQFGTALARIDELLRATDHAEEVRAHLELARGLALAASGKTEAADEQLAAVEELDGLSISDRLRAHLRRTRIALEQGRHDVVERRLEEAAGMLAAAPEPVALEVRAAHAGLTVHLQRTKPRADAAVVTAARQTLASIQETLLGHVRRTQVEFGGVGFLHFEDAHQILADQIDAVLTLADDADGRERAVELLLQAQAHGSLSRALGADPSLAAVRDALPESGGALAYVPSWRGSHLFAIERTRITHVRLGPRDRLERLAKNVASRLLQPGSDAELAKAAETASQALLPQPALDVIAPWPTIVLCGTETLGQLPFEALPLPDHRLLGEAKAIANVSALPLLPHLLANRPQAAPMRRLGFVGQLDPEPAVRTALKQDGMRVPDGLLAALLQPFAAADRTVLVDAAATPTAIAALPFQEFEVVHILAHGFSDVTRRFGHGIALRRDTDHPDGMLWPEAVLDWHIRGLWILSACNAGRAPRRVGEDHGANFGGALLRAGAHGVIQARGTLVTADLLPMLTTLHPELAAGTPVAEALRRARCAVASPTEAQRFHAAQLQLFGAWR